MKKKILFILGMALLMFSSVFAVEDDTNLEQPGVTPDSMLYGLDKVFDKFQSDESVANERAAEAIAMARENKLEDMNKAMEGYDEAMLRKTEKSKEKNDTSELENDARHAAKHMEVLAKVREQVPESAQDSIDKVIEKAAARYNDSINEIEKKDKEKARVLSEVILKGLLEKLPETGKAGVENALEAHNRTLNESKNINEKQVLETSNKGNR